MVWKLDRLGRSTRHLLDGFKECGIKFRSLRDGIATDPDTELGGAMAQAMVTIISAFARLERDQLSERTRAGMAAAAANGRRAGRRELTADHPNVRDARELKAQSLKPADIGKVIGASRATVYRDTRGRGAAVALRNARKCLRRPFARMTGGSAGWRVRPWLVTPARVTRRWPRSFA